MRTNQKRFQCERPQEKRAVLRERKEALGSPVNKVDRVEGVSWLQSAGPVIAKAHVRVIAGQRDHDGQVSVADEERWQSKASG